MLIILDRDGVINFDSDEYIKTPDEWKPIPGSLEAIARLKKAGHIVVVATNQSGIARGYYTLETLTAIHEKMKKACLEHETNLDAIYFCPHHPDDLCNCRKPKTGMIEKILRDYSFSAKNTIVIGDSLSDILAAQTMNCSPMLVLTGKGTMTSKKITNQAILIFSNLLQAATNILKQFDN